MPFERLEPNTLVKQVSQIIRGQIISGALKSNERIIETKIAEELGISRGPVREALGELKKDGLIVIIPRKGAYIRNFTQKDIEEIYTLRALLEGFAAKLAIDKINEQALAELRSILDKIEEMASRNDIVEVGHYNMRFHEEVCKLSGHQRILDIWHDLLGQIQVLSAMATHFYMDFESIKKSHEILMDSLIRRDRIYAKECFENHILNYMRELIQHVKRIQEQRPSTEKIPGPK